MKSTLAGRTQTWPRDPASVDGPATSVTFRFCTALMLMLLVVALDVGNFFERGSAEGGSPLRYLLLLPPFLVAAAALFRSNEPLILKGTAPDQILFVLFLYGIVGSLIGRIMFAHATTLVPFFLCMSIGLIYRASVDGLTDAETSRLRDALYWLGVVYLAVDAIVNTNLIPSLAGSLGYRNAKLYFLPLALMGAWARGRRRDRLLAVALSAVVFLAYPSATFVISLFAIMLTVFLITHVRRATSVFIVSMIVVGGMFFLLSRPTQPTGFLNRYFAAVGKQNNNDTRLALWDAGLLGVRRRPIFGEGFTGETTVTVRTSGVPYFTAPYHSDPLLIAVAGGVFALALLLAWIAAVNAAAARAYRLLRTREDLVRADLLRLLLAAFNVFWASALFNPLIQTAATAASLFAVYSMIMLLIHGSIRSPIGPTPLLQAEPLRDAARD